MISANVKLSKSEMEMVCNEEIILTKISITDKVYTLFGYLSERYKERTKQNLNIFPEEVLATYPKIYKGEQYKKLPYVMLDYPRYFTKEKVMAIRSLFWWGNFFSITLHLAGEYVHTYAPAIKKFFEINRADNWFISVNENQWEHDFKPDNYIAANKLASEIPFSIINGKAGFIKIAQKISLEEWDSAEVFFIKAYQEIINMLSV